MTEPTETTPTTPTTPSRDETTPEAAVSGGDQAHGTGRARLRITLNDEPHDADPGTTVRGLVEHVTGHRVGDDGHRPDGGRLGVAVAVDETVVPRSLWSARTLVDGERVDVVTAVQGG